MANKTLTLRALTLTPLALLLAACAPPLTVTAPPPEPPRIPALPPQARQPQMPLICSPTCSQGLTMRRESWQQQLMQPTQPAQPASAPTTH